MSRSSITRAGWAAVVALALVVAGCSSDDPEPQSGPRTIKVVHIPGALDNIPLYVADEFGFFAEQGLKVEYTSAGGGQAGMQAMIAGEADFTTATVGALALVNAQGADARFAARFEDRFTAGLVCNRAVGATPGGYPANTDALRGKKIGLSGPGAGSDIFTRYTLVKAGLDPDKDVSIQYLGTLPQILAALDSNAIDCGIAVQPILTEYQKKYDLTISWEKGEGPTELKEAIFLGIVTTQRLDDSNPGLLKKVDAAIQKAHAHLNDRANAGQVAERTKRFFTGLDTALLTELVGSLAGSYQPEPIDAASLAASIQIWNTVSKDKITVDAANLIATSIRNG